jgi:arabinose-5-phosphate isomerase
MVASPRGKRPQADKLTTPEVGAAPLSSALRTIGLEAGGLAALEAILRTSMAETFARATALMAAAKGRIIVTGIGKSGHIGRKIAATLASTGTPAYFVHPTEASHGDLGMVTRDDVLLVLSWSGETAELAAVINYSGRFAVPMVAVTSRAESSLAKAAAVALVLPRAPEACPHGLAPTTSTTMQLVLGDCLAIALLEGKGFSANDFKAFHPGGQLGASLRHVGDVMHKGEGLPLAREGAAMAEAVVTMTEKSLGCLGVVDGKGKLVGVITDGDLRRNMGAGLLARPCADIMNRKPKTVGPELLASAALEMLNAAKITALFVVEAGKPVGVIHVHDLLRLGVV